MNREQTLDLSRLLGFDQVATDASSEIDFQDDCMGAKLGAKRGDVEPTMLPADDGQAAKA